jgi:hypothetical protein
MASTEKPHNIVVCCDGTWAGAETGEPKMSSFGTLAGTQASSFCVIGTSLLFYVLVYAGTRGNIQVIADGFASQGQHAYVHALDGEPVYNSYTNTDICYFNGVGLDGLEDLAKEGKQLPPGLGLLGGFGDTLLYIANGIIANDLPERCKEAYG